MNQIERILQEATKFSSSHIFDKNSAYNAMQETALAFTKWKDENYTRFNIETFTCYVQNRLIVFEELISKDEYKTLEQLFDEWNNLKP